MAKEECKICGKNIRLCKHGNPERSAKVSRQLKIAHAMGIRKTSKNFNNAWLGKKRSKEDREKMRKAKLGKFREMANNWRGGIDPERVRIRKLFQYRQWRSDVFTRDNFTCVICSKKASGNLNADHYPKMFAQILDEYKIKTLEEAVTCAELWNINNGRTLCEPCHRKTRTGVPKKPWQK